MHIAFVTTSYPTADHDAAGHFVRSEARTWVRRGHQVTVLAPGIPEPPARDGIRVVSVPGGDAFGFPGVAARLREAPLRAFDAARAILRMGRVVQGLEAAQSVDRWVAHWAFPSAWPIAHRVRAPLDVVSHGADVRLLVGVPALFREAFVGRVVERASQWRFVSQSLALELLEVLPPSLRKALEAKASVAPSPLEFPDVERRRAALKRRLGPRPMLIAVGRLIPTKRVDRIIDYVANLHPAPNGPRPLLVVVGDGPERSRLERLARARGVASRFLGHVDRKRALAWLGASDALIFASEKEGCSTVIREAEALGVPVHVLR